MSTSVVFDKVEEQSFEEGVRFFNRAHFFRRVGKYLQYLGCEDAGETVVRMAFSLSAQFPEAPDEKGGFE